MRIDEVRNFTALVYYHMDDGHLLADYYMDDGHLLAELMSAVKWADYKTSNLSMDTFTMKRLTHCIVEIWKIVHLYMKSIDNNYNMITIWKLIISSCYVHTNINYEHGHGHEH